MEIPFLSAIITGISISRYYHSLFFLARHNISMRCLSRFIIAILLIYEKNNNVWCWMMLNFVQKLMKPKKMPEFHKWGKWSTFTSWCNKSWFYKDWVKNHWNQSMCCAATKKIEFGWKIFYITILLAGIYFFVEEDVHLNLSLVGGKLLDILVEDEEVVTGLGLFGCK